MNLPHTEGWEGKIIFGPQVHDIMVRRGNGEQGTIHQMEELISSLLTEAYEEGKKERDELVEALLGMYSQYCNMGHDFMTAGETASTILEQYGYASFDEAGRMTLSEYKRKET